MRAAVKAVLARSPGDGACGGRLKNAAIQCTHCTVRLQINIDCCDSVVNEPWYYLIYYVKVHYTCLCEKTFNYNMKNISF